jgi:hypothetical protein
MALKNLADQENGCATTSSEQAVDNCHQGDPGEFSSQGYIRVRYTNPAPASDVNFGGNSCAAPGGYVNSTGYSPASDNDATKFPRLSGFAIESHDLGTLKDGEAVCVRVDLGLDENANNKVQGDSSTFDVEFRLDQVV